jgi:hypothetical protein
MSFPLEDVDASQVRILRGLLVHADSPTACYLYTV